MKNIKILLAIILFFFTSSVYGQQPIATWEKWYHLLGEWVGDGAGQPGQGDGKFSFQSDLDGKILIRENHTIFPATSTTKEMTHDDLLIVYPGTSGGAQEAIYFDNEGNIIKYKVSFSDKSVILTSDIVANAPRFRLSYVTIDSKTVNITFEMASPQTPDVFKMYLSGKAFKTTGPSAPQL